jgi:hypothetical protein
LTPERLDYHGGSCGHEIDQQPWSHLTSRWTGSGLSRSSVAILPVVSTKNVEIVRRWTESLSATPQQALASAAEFWDADADYYPVRKFPEARPCHGPDEVMQFLVGYREVWSQYD